MARLLLANFAFEILPLAMIVVGIVLIARARRGGVGSGVKRYLGLSLISLPAGILAYIIAGAVAASVRGEGHFYSVPFGGYQVSNNTAIGFSALCWIGLLFFLLAVLTRRPG